MSKDPAFLFYSSDFLTGVSDLTMEERGLYVTLLCIQHQKGRLTERAIKIVCRGIADAGAVQMVLAKFKKDSEGLYYNERLEVEAEKRAQHAEKQRLRALKGWEKRKKAQSQHKATVNAAALPLENEDVNEDVNRNRIKGDSAERGKIIPSVDEFLEHGKNLCSLAKVDFNSLEFSIRAKYKTWVDDGWKDGHKKPIKNWKNKLANTLPHLKRINNAGNTKGINAQSMAEVAQRLAEKHAASQGDA